MPAIGTVYQPPDSTGYPATSIGPIAAPMTGPMLQPNAAGGPPSSQGYTYNPSLGYSTPNSGQPPSSQGYSGQGQPQAPQGQGGGSWNQGGGWNQFAQQPGTPQNALQQAFAQGLTGQAAVDAANSSLGLQPPNSISYGADGSYGLPNGFYVAPNAQNGGALDLIQRGGGGGGGGGGGQNGFGGGFQFDPNSTTNNPGYQFAMQQALNGAMANKAAQGVLLGTGAQKDLMQYASGVASQWEPTLFNQALQGYQANFGDLYALSNLGYSAGSQMAGYQQGAGNAQAAGTVGSSNAQNAGLGGVNAAANQAYYQGLYGGNPNSQQGLDPWNTWGSSGTALGTYGAPAEPGGGG